MDISLWRSHCKLARDHNSQINIHKLQHMVTYLARLEKSQGTLANHTRVQHLQIRTNNSQQATIMANRLSIMTAGHGSIYSHLRTIAMCWQ